MIHLLVIIPLYNAEQEDFRFNTDPSIRFEKWNRQIKHVEPEEIPDAVAIFDEEVNRDRALYILEGLGLPILPLIFEKAYFAYSVADENSVKMRHSTAGVFYREGYQWIKPEKLQVFLDIALNSYFAYNLDLVLKIRYEADFMSNSMEVKFHLHWMILEILSKTFCDTKRVSPISDVTIENMIAIANEELASNQSLSTEERIQRLNLVKQNLKNRLKEKSHRDLLSEFLSDKCHLRVDSDIIKKMAALHGKIIKTASFDYSEDEIKIFSITDYLSHLSIIISLTDFDENFSTFLQIHNFLGTRFFDWRI